MAGTCGCAKCCPACPPPQAGSPYDEVCHEVDNNFIAIRVGKNVPQEAHPCPGQLPAYDKICADAYGKCMSGCAKVNVIPDRLPPPKKPTESAFLIRATKQYLNADDMKNSLMIGYIGPRNYVPLPDPGPTPPIIKIVPKKRGKGKAKGLGKGKKGKKGKK